MAATAFLSSTFLDLIEHRKAVLYVLNRLRTWIEAMEFYGSDTDEPLEVCLEAVDRSNIYIGIFGTRYGSVDETGVSITQREYERAYERQKHILVYLVDEDRAVVPLAQVDRGESAEKLVALKNILRKRHTCSRFSDPSDLGVKVGIDLIRYIQPSAELAKSAEAMVHSIPTMLFQAGYGLGLSAVHLQDAKSLLVSRDGQISFRDTRTATAASAGALASRLCDADFSVLNGTMTFDKDFLELLVFLLRLWNLDPTLLASEIRRTHDPVKFRVLVMLAGRLAAEEAVEPICEAVLRDYALHRTFKELSQVATPVRDVVKKSLGAMPSSALPTVQRYADRAKEMQRWQQKSLLDDVIRLLLRKHQPSGDA